MPPTNADVEDLVNFIFAAPEHTSDKLHKCSVNWVDCLLAQCHNKLQIYWSWPLDTVRAKLLNLTTISHWYYDIIKKHYIDKEFLSETHTEWMRMDLGMEPLVNSA